MKPTQNILIPVFVGLLFGELAPESRGVIRLPNIIGDHMVWRQNATVNLFRTDDWAVNTGPVEP